MKNANGTYEPWANDPAYRDDVMRRVLIVYYVLFAIVLTLAFLVLPLAFFYHATSPLADDQDDQEQVESRGKKLLRAAKYTSASVILLLALILLGIFLPFETSPSLPLANYFQQAWTNFKGQEGFNMIVFVMNSISVVGMGLLVLYTGMGMSALPFDWICGSSQLNSALSQIEEEIAS